MGSRLVVLVSGNGSNLQALIDATAGGKLAAEIVGVVANRPEARGLQRAERAGVPAVALPADPGESRPEYDARLAARVADFEPDLVVLAGWMRILTMSFLGEFPVINLHPALPGRYPGTRAIERAFADWEAGGSDESGAMVHWVPDEGVDVGPAIAVRRVPLVGGDTLDTFAERMHRTEHSLLVEAVGAALTSLADGTAPRPRSDLMRSRQ